MQELEENKKDLGLPTELIDGTGIPDEDDEYVLVKGIEIKNISMLERQGLMVINDIERGELSQTEGLPILFYNTDKDQLIVDDGNHRIFQKYLAGEDFIDALVYSSSWHPVLRHVYEGEKEFDWSLARRPKDVHEAAESAGIPWDNEESFMDFSEEITGERHLDDMSQYELEMMLDEINKLSKLKTWLLKMGHKEEAEFLKKIIKKLN